MTTSICKPEKKEHQKLVVVLPQFSAILSKLSPKPRVEFNH
jgi:hypothetical protein